MKTSNVVSIFCLAFSIAVTACGGSSAQSSGEPNGQPASMPAEEAEPVVGSTSELEPGMLTMSEIMAEANARLDEELAAFWADVVEAPDRTEDDIALDAQRLPIEIFGFFGIMPDQRVADLFAGGGYTTELLARAVGAGGMVYSQNNAYVLDRFARGPQAERLERLGYDHIEAVELELDAPIPGGVTDLDAVIFILAYHDSVWMETDRAAMNQAIFDSLRPGGVYGIVDHNAEDGSGVRDVQTLHRIERQTVIDEVTAAGFVLEAELDVLRNPDDARDWSASPGSAGELRGTSDRFTLRFVRPEQ